MKSLKYGIVAASAICGEKERQTFDIMLTTAIKPFQIVWGKLLSVIVRIMMFAIAAVPIVLFTFIGVNTLIPGLHSYGAVLPELL